MDSGLREHEDIVKKYFGTVIPSSDNKFAALNTAVWSGGSFLYVPKGVHVEVPLQAYFRINTKNMGQFERTLIIAEPGSTVHYLEGCSSPTYTSDSLHSAVVEIIAMEGSRVQYTTIQNWYSDVYNLVTKRAKAFKDATMFWLDGNIGSKVTMKYPAVLLMEPGARGEVVSVALAGAGQHQDAGAKIFHLASNTSSISITRLGSSYALPDQFIGMHFMNPVPVMKLIEIIRGLSTSNETYQTIKSISESLEKTPVEVNDFPGFVSNRVLLPMLNEAMFCVMEGVATPEAIAAASANAGYPAAVRQGS